MANKYIDPSQNPFAGGLSTGADSRSVIKNATTKQGKGGTIATKKEIEEQKAAKKPIKVKTEAKKVDTSKALDNVKTPIQTPTTNVNKPITTVPPINTTQDPLKKAVSNIVGPQTVKVTSNSIPEANGSNNALLKIRQEAEEAKNNKTDYAYQNIRNVIQNKVDIDTALEDLFYDIEMNDKQGYSILDADLNQIKNDYKEFNGLDDATLAGLVQDMYGIYKDGIRMDAGGIKEIYQLYPELNMLKTGWLQNYRGGGQTVAGGFRGAINNMVRGFGTADINGEQVQYDESGNPIWNAMDKMNVIGNAASNFDRFAQEAFQVQGSEGEEAIRKKLLSMNEDDLADKYREFATWAKNNPYKAEEYIYGNSGIYGDRSMKEGFSNAGETLKHDFSLLLKKKYFSTDELNKGFQNWLIDDITKEVYGDDLTSKWTNHMNVGVAFKEDKKDTITDKALEAAKKFDENHYSWLEEYRDNLKENYDLVMGSDEVSSTDKWIYDKATAVFDILNTVADMDVHLGEGVKGAQMMNYEKALNNLPGSTVKTVAAITNAFTNPLDTAVGLGTLLFTEEGHKAIAERYGSIEAWTKAWEEDPAGTFSDVLAIGEMGFRTGSAAVSLMKDGALKTAIVAELMGGKNFAKNALKVSTRLESMEASMIGVANFLDTTSNFGVNKLKDAMVAGFRKMGNSSNLLVKVGGKYLHMSQAPLQATTELLKNLESGGLVKDATKLAQQITQGDKKTGEALIRAKESGYLDTEGVKDYKDLQDRVKQGERAYGEDIESVLNDEEGFVNKENTTERTADGTEYNRYQDAIDGLKELYEKTGDYEGLDLIKKLEEKFNGEGLTKTEAKKLIASYGREFNSKGWGKNGEALTSQSAEKVQNTKNGMNERLKNNIGDEARAAMEIIDRSYGDLKTVERSLNKIQKRLENMDKSVESGGGWRNTVGNAAAAIGIITDVLGGHGIGTIAGLIVKNLTKTPSKLNIKGIEKKLSNNLERLDKTLNIVNKRKSSASVGLLATTLHKMGVINDKKYNQVKNLLNGNTTEKIKPSNLVKGLAKKEGSALRDDLISVVKELDEVEQFKDMREVLNFFKNRLSEADYKAVDKVLTGKEYDYAQGKSRITGGDRELRMAKGDRDSVVKWVKEHSNNPGYVVRLLDETGMMKALVEAGDVAQKGVEGFKDPYNKYINLLKNPLDTTAQHEFFHAVFEVIDKKTKDKILAEAKKILKQENMSDEAAEERLAESFGIYAKRKMFDAGILKGKKGWTAKLERMVRDFFQKAYEWIQNFNGDRETINKIFEEIYGGNTKIGENGLLDLSYLLEEDKKLGIKDTKLDTKEVKAEVKPKALEKKPESKPVEKKEKPLEVKKETRREILGEKFYKDLEKQVEIINESRKGIKDPITVEELDLSSELYEKRYEKIVDAEMKELQDEYQKIIDEYDKMNPGAKEAREYSQKQLEQLEAAKTKEEREKLRDKRRKEYDEKYPMTDEQLKKVEELVKKGTEMANRHGKVREYLWQQQQNKGSNIRKKAVYHGSPADFDKFDSSHMGEGEGNQAHGWGHYVAVNKGTAKGYANLYGNGKSKWSYKGKNRTAIRDMAGLQSTDENIASYLMARMEDDKMSFEKAKADYVKDYKEYVETLKNRVEQVKQGDYRIYDSVEYAEKILRDTEKELKILENMSKDDFSKTTRNLYTIDIPDPKKADTPTGSNYLDEKAELTPKKFSEFMDILKEKKPDIFENPKHMDPLLTFFKEGQKIEGINGSGLYNTLENVLGGSKEASKFLESLGYDGIHYFGGRDGEAYVIFNDDALQINDHIRWKKKIGDKDVEINKDITSPDQMAKFNDRGLSIIHDFISERQAEKALDVSKDILDKDGNAYLWTHTNKYNSQQFANFENAHDSKYKGFKDNEIGWFSNSREMSRSYADYKSKLADTKPINSIEEFNKTYKDYNINEGHVKPEWTKSKISGALISDDYRFEIEKKGDDYVLSSKTNNYAKYNNVDEMYKATLPRDFEEGLSSSEQIKAVKDYIKKEFIDNKDFKLYDGVEVIQGKDGVTLRTYTNTVKGVYKTEQEALAKGKAAVTAQGKYHYQGIIQDMKNPLVIDLGKYGNGEVRYGRDVSGKARYWNDLGNAYDFLKKTDEGQLDKLVSAIDDISDRARTHQSDYRKLQDKVDKVKDAIKNELTDARMEIYEAKKDGDLIKIEAANKKELEIWKKQDDFNLFRNIMDAKPDTIDAEIISSLLKKYPEWKKLYNNYEDFNKVHGDDVKTTLNNSLIELVKEKYGVDASAASLLHDFNLYEKAGEFLNGIEALKNKSLQTNDIVFYALNKGDYDGVLFKDIVDYGGKTNNPKGGDVLATFNSKQFKAWDNANPTDSKYISYKKKVGLDKKSEGLSKKDSNGLLAKGRVRTFGNYGMRYKTNISERDSSGKKLSEGQKKFFAGSKVVDKDGNLLRVYHGTVAGDFTVFQKYGNRTSNNIASDVGFWFTPNKKGAINFAKESSWRGDNKARAEEVYLDIKNPKVYEPSEFNLKDYEERDKLIDSKYKEVYAARNEMNEYDYNHFWMGEYTHGNHVNRGIFNKLDYIYNQKGKITEADLKDIKEEYSKINWNGYYKPEIDATYEDFKNYLQAKKKYDKLNDEYLEMKHSDSYDDFKADIYKLDNKKRDKLDFALDDMDAAKKYIDNLKKEGYDGIIIKGTEYDGATLGEGARNDQYVAFDSNQIKRITNENPTKNDDIRFKKNSDGLEEKQRVYHGTNRKFSKFSNEFDMTSQPAGNTYGPGIYVSEDLEKAKWFGGTEPKGKSVKYVGKGNPYWVSGLMEKGKSFDSAVKSEIRRAENWKREAYIYGNPKERAEFLKDKDDMIADLKALKKEDFKVENLQRRYIELDIDKMHDADTPTGKNYFRAQGNGDEKIQAKFNEKLREKYGDSVQIKIDNYGNGDYILKELWRLLGKKETNKFLSELGYDGIKYFHKDDGDAYVIFKDTKANEGLGKSIRFKKQTDTPEFKKWFEGSKVVNEDGTPKIMYHGTPVKGITKFDAKHRGENTGNYGYAGDGFYFTESPNYAKSYGDNVMAVYLDVKKPFRFTKENIKKYAKYFDGVEQGHIALDKEWVLNELKRNDKLSYEFAKDWLKNKNEAWSRMPYPYKTKYDPNTIVDLLKETEWDGRPYEFESKYLDEFEGFGKPKYVDDLYSYPSNPDYMLGMGEYSNQDFIDAIRKDGFDGIESLGETVVFEPNQIKSTTDNIGTFDKNNPDIRFKKGLQKKDSSPARTNNGTALGKNPLTESIVITQKISRDINNNLDNLGKSVGWKVNEPKDFLKQLQNAFQTEGNSVYITNYIKGNDYTLRISDHNSYGKHALDRNHPNRNTSIVIKFGEGRYRPMKGVSQNEFVYDPSTLTPEIMRGIIKGVKDWMAKGEYTDTNYTKSYK